MDWKVVVHLRYVLTYYKFKNKFLTRYAIACARTVTEISPYKSRVNSLLNTCEAYLDGRVELIDADQARIDLLNIYEEADKVATIERTEANIAVADAAYAYYTAAYMTSYDSSVDSSLTADIVGFCTTANGDTDLKRYENLLNSMIKDLSDIELVYIGIDDKLREFLDNEQTQ